MFRKLFAGALLAITALFTNTVVHADPLTLISLEEKFNEAKPAVCATFSRNLAQLTSAELHNFFRIKGRNVSQANVPILRQDQNVICAHDLEFGTDYTFAFLRMLSAEGGGSLSRDEIWTLTTASKRPQFSFLDDPGLVEGDFDLRRISMFVRSINIKKMRVALFSIPDDEIASEIQQDSYKSNIGIEKAVHLILSGGRLVDSKLINPQEQNNVAVISHFILNFSQGAEGTPLLIACDPSLEVEDILKNALYNRQFGIWGAKLFQKNSLSVALNRFKNNLLIEVHSSRNAKPIANANVRLYTNAGKLTVSGKTDKDGHTEIDLSSASDVSNLTRYAVVEADEGYSRLEIPAPLDNELEVQRGPNLNFEGILALTDKQSYKPGEIMRLLLISRNPDLKASTINKVRVQIISPSGVAVRDQILQDNGGSSFFTQFNIPEKSQTGSWTIKILRENGQNLSLKHFFVQRMLPSDFTVKASVAQGELSAGSDEFMKIRTSYRDDSPASGLNADSWLFFTPEHAPFKNHQGYVTGPDLSLHQFLAEYLHFKESKSDQDGNVSLSFKLPDTGYPMRADIASMLSDSTGKSSHYIKRFNIKTSGNVCGLKHDPNSDKVQVRLFDKDGNAVAGRVNYDIYRLQSLGVYEHLPEGWRFEVRKERIPLRSGSIVLIASEDHTQNIDVPSDGGEYYIKASTQSGVITELSFANRFRQKDLLEAELLLNVPDKVTWPGDPVEVKFHSPYDGYAVVEIDSGHKSSRSNIKLKRGENKFLVALSKDLGDQAFIRVQAFYSRSLRGVMRAKGVAILNIDRPDATLEPILTFSNKPTAGQKLNIGLSGLSHNSKTYYSAIAQLENSAQRSNDSVDEIISSNNDEQRTFYFSGIAVADISNDTMHIELPDENGILHLRVLIWNKNGFGLVERHVEIFKPHNIDVDVPQFINNGDTLLASVKVSNNSAHKVRRFELKIGCQGAAQCLLNRVLPLDSGEEHEYLVPITASMQAGEASMRIDADYDAHYETKLIKLQVKRPTTVSRTTDCVELQANETKSFTPDSSYDRIEASADVGPIPYLNRLGFTEALSNAANGSTLDQLYALTVMLDCNYMDISPDETINSITALRNQQNASHKLQPMLQERLDELQAKMNTNGTLQLLPADFPARNLITIKAAQALNSGLRRGFTVNRDLVRSALRNVADLARGHSTDYEQAEAIWTLMDSDSIILAKELAHKIANRKDIKSPSALALISILTYKNGDKRAALALLEKAMNQFEALEELRKKIGELSDPMERDMLRTQYQEFAEPTFTSSAFNAAMLLSASTYLHENKYQSQIIKKLQRNRNILAAQTPVVAALLAQLRFISEDYLTLSQFTSKQSHYELGNKASSKSYATVMVKSYNEPKEKPDPNFPYEGSIRLYNTDGIALRPDRLITLHRGEELLLVIEVRALENRLHNLKMQMSLSSGITLERFLNINESRFPVVDMLYPISYFERHDNTAEIAISRNRKAKLFRIGAVVRASYPGTFVIPQIRLIDSDGRTDVINVPQDSRITIR